MKNKMVFEFDSINLFDARIFYNTIKSKVIELFRNEPFIKNLKTRLDCSIL